MHLQTHSLNDAWSVSVQMKLFFTPRTREVRSGGVGGSAGVASQVSGEREDVSVRVGLVA